jgi:HlyD family secretion protein
MTAEVDVDENDIVLVKIGDTATIEIDALPNSTYKGVVIEVGHSASSSSTAASTLSQTTTFNVKIRLIDREPQLRPGMSCNVEIHTATHSNVIAVPLQSVTSREGEMKVNDSNMDNAGGGPPSISKVIDETKSINNGIPQTIVFIRKNNVATIRKVTIGISDMGYVEILSGLNENEEIISGSYQAISKLLAEGTKVIEEKVLQHK